MERLANELETHLTYEEEHLIPILDKRTPNGAAGPHGCPPEPHRSQSAALFVLINGDFGSSATPS
ncbi:hypothetical protein AB0C28_56150 [Nonomuraea sp. NPDC048892]|uniref:hypothetical protein n=1 Tax=Nonomuraea sp. NPDC048892 TaxID=3154624 RepID=UPI0033D20F73